ncbi:hypothetical protein FK531_05445 [Rhodococcus spelaei]|uniref:Uncharacterized protein n=1 Tax=Rhodococcus spelaei TaxID=2546320 RepID=A0A541BP42_9NOCA|nr:hypothetical protein [Rhodococcus spelaei]TQF74097.1 hypothetical protein FK531_05445 [Rhodococcus spelaei]
MGQFHATTTRIRRITIAALGVSAAAALAVPGAAWASTGVPTGDPVAAVASALGAGSSDAATKSCGGVVKPVSEAEMQKLLGGGLPLTEDAGAFSLDVHGTDKVDLNFDESGVNVIEITPRNC